MIDFRPTVRSGEGLKEVQQLLNELFPKAKHLDQRYLDWAYYQNPLGSAVTANAYVDNNLVGHSAAQPIRARLFSKDEQGLMFIHAAVRARYRVYQGEQVYNTLVDRSIAEAIEAGYTFFVGFTNAASTRFMERRRDDIAFVTSLDAKVGIGPLPMGGAQEEAQFTRIWDAQTLAWRLARPGSTYRQRTKVDRCTLYARSAIPGMAVQLGQFSPDRIQTQLPRISPLSPLRVWVGLDPDRDWSHYAYIDIPKKRRPSPLNLVFSDLTGQGRSLDARRVYVNALDLDAF